MFPGSRGLGSSGAAFDNSNFPMLGGGSGAPSLGRNTSYGAGAGGMYGGGQIRNDEDFTIEKEDFPALPGSHGHKSDASAIVGSQSMGRDLGLVGGGSALAQAHQQQQPAAEYSGAFGSTPGFDRNSGLNIGGLIGAQGAGSVLSSIHGTGSAAGAAGGVIMSTEVRFGLAGLLDIIRMTDKVNFEFALFDTFFLDMVFACCRDVSHCLRFGNVRFRLVHFCETDCLN